MSTSNIAELRAELLHVFDGLRTGAIDVKDAVEVNNTAGKIISTVKLELAHAALCGTVPNIPFLKTADEGEQVTLTVSRQALTKGLTEAA